MYHCFQFVKTGTVKIYTYKMDEKKKKKKGHSWNIFHFIFEIISTIDEYKIYDQSTIMATSQFYSRVHPHCMMPR